MNRPLRADPLQASHRMTISSSSNPHTMEKYTLSMVRTYATTFEVFAQSEEEALEILKNNEARYSEELKQCNVVEEYYQTESTN